jgi:hypothetical protein
MLWEGLLYERLLGIKPRFARMFLRGAGENPDYAAEIQQFKLFKVLIIKVIIMMVSTKTETGSHTHEWTIVKIKIIVVSNPV